MGRGGAIYLSYTALVLLSAASGARADNFWSIDIDEGPAPSPQDGPPFSAHATRDKALLPYQIIGICAGYLGSVLILGTLLLTVGRRLRKRAQEMASRPQEMIKPYTHHFDLSPSSPSSQRGWRRLQSVKNATGSVRSGVSPVSPSVRSLASFDAAVIEQDRLKRQDEMERLYAAVMAHDNRKSQGSLPTTTEVPVTAPPEYSRKNPPKLITSAPALRRLHTEEGHLTSFGPGSPKSPIRAIYPPDSALPPMLVSPGSPLRAEYPTTPLTPTYFSQASQAGEFRPERSSRASSLGSSKTMGSWSGRSRLRKPLRHLKISAPIQQGDDNDDGARTPLSPRFTNPGTPPEPPTARTADSQYPPTTPGSVKSWRHGDEPDLRHEPLDEVRALPLPHPNRADYNYENQAQAATNLASLRPDPTGTTLQNKQQPVSASASNTLPFRQLQAHQQAQNAAYAAAHPLSPMPWNQGYPLSAGPVKTTFLERRNDRLGGGGGPRTAGVATPYSPYMPFTPLTPVTPHLTSRAERQQKRKEERMVRGVITEEDAVADERDLWSSGY